MARTAGQTSKAAERICPQDKEHNRIFPTDKKMGEKSGTKTSQNAGCSWCKTPLGLSNRAYESVCVRCCKLLMGANLSDEEIFGSHRREKKLYGT
ncbi:MAG: hypothetical protein LH614_19670 [Pyrinomonadaceae bacterium]|nr:hypothetical protein [Pyrinomonadaceae bacterium]